MYNANVGLAATGVGAAFAGMNGLWWLLGGFALIAAGTALMRIVPVRTEKSTAR